jgi:hypothetical protein
MSHMKLMFWHKLKLWHLKFHHNEGSKKHSHAMGAKFVVFVTKITCYVWMDKISCCVILLLCHVIDCNGIKSCHDSIPSKVLCLISW